MHEREAEEVLSDTELVPLIEGALGEVKRIWRRCLERDIPAAVGPPAGPGCGTRLALLVREEDAGRVGELLRQEWREVLEREGVAPAARMGVEAGEGEEPPCPACGTAAPLENGACRECGLQLE